MEETIATYDAIFKQFAVLVTVMMVLPIIVALFYRQYWHRPLLFFFRFHLLSFLIHVFMQLFIWIVGKYYYSIEPYLIKWDIKDTNFISILSYLNNFALLGAFYVIITKSMKLSKSIQGLSIALFLIALVNYLFIEGFRVYSFFNATASALFCFILPLIHFYNVFSTQTEVSIKRNSFFWIGLGLIIPNVLGLFLHFTGNKLYKDDIILYFQLSIIKYCFVIVAQFFIAYAFYLSRYTKYLPEKW